MEVSEPCEKIFAYLVWSLGLWIWLSTIVAGRLDIPYHNFQLFIIYLFIYSFIYLSIYHLLFITYLFIVYLFIFMYIYLFINGQNGTLNKSIHPPKYWLYWMLMTIKISFILVIVSNYLGFFVQLFV